MHHRISWVDICRGIAILLVLYGHAIADESQRFIIYAFHMPLFFFISGFVFNHNPKKTFQSVVIKNCKTILLPYLLFASLTFAVDLIVFPPQQYTLSFIEGQILGILYGNGGSGGLGFNVALWFLPCLFATKVLFAFLMRVSKRQSVVLFALFLFSLLGYYFSVFQQTQKLFFSLEIVFTSIVFFGAGYLLKATERLKHILMHKTVILFFVSAVSTLLFAWLNFHMYHHQIDLRVNRLNNYAYFYLGAFSGILFCVTISILLKKNMFLEYLGKHSMALFVWHTALFRLFTTYNIPPLSFTFLLPSVLVIQAGAIILLGNMILTIYWRRQKAFLLRRSQP